MKLYDKNTLKNTIAFAVIGFLMIPLIVWAIDTVATGFRATSTEKKINMTTHTNKCYYVRSKTASDYFVPTKTAAEWTAFDNNHSTAQMEKWACGVQENNCRVGYDYLIDGDDAPIRYAGYTDNTNTYDTWSYSLDTRNDDEHCNGGCGLRASVQCTDSAYAIRVWYQYDLKNSQSVVRYTPRSDVSTAFGSWASVSTNSQYECDQWCGIRMFIETRWDDALVNCSIWYRHRIEDVESAWAYNGAWSTFTNTAGNGEDCEVNGGCGMQARIYCDGPGAANWWIPTPAAGQCGPADGNTYSGQPPASQLCSTGTAASLENMWGAWTWSCNTSGWGDYCFSQDSSWWSSSTSWNPLN